MISAWWLLAAGAGGVFGGLILGAMLSAAKEADRRSEELARAAKEKEREPVTVRARRDIPEDVWLDRIMRTDAKTAQAQLQLSMAQQLAALAAPHVAIGYVFDPKTRTYKVWGEARVLPFEGWK